MLRIPHSEIEGASVDDLHHDPVRHKQLREGLADNEIRWRPVTLHRRDGTELHLNLGVSSVITFEGEKFFIAVGQER